MARAELCSSPLAALTANRAEILDMMRMAGILRLWEKMKDL
jgi:hypothetical protein